ncbi:hypothetical protein NONO_c15140 [Nocardia nova SH22a]|uniref:Mce-associated membrane protein n=1 Tax=Nocardia nova SH22a TaxID=1415166 RepID=W5TAF3_9NOCA|nr:hypothetical protein [Nocardia nova]AHH16315.1 hypothetical protein NONO_c15140 [Nocardia nova SH22a]
MTSEPEQPTPDDDSSDTTGPSRPWLRRTAATLVVTTALAGTAAAVVFGMKYHRADARDDAREAARRAACAYGPILATYDSKSIDAYFTAVLDRATGAWKQEFDSTSKDLRDVLTQGQVVSKAGTVRCAIESSGADSAEGILVIDQSISSVGTQGQPRHGQLAITLSLQRDGNRWLVSKVDSPALQP